LEITVVAPMLSTVARAVPGEGATAAPVEVVAVGDWLGAPDPLAAAEPAPGVAVAAAVTDVGDPLQAASPHVPITIRAQSAPRHLVALRACLNADIGNRPPQ